MSCWTRPHQPPAPLQLTHRHRLRSCPNAVHGRRVGLAPTGKPIERCSELGDRSEAMSACVCCSASKDRSVGIEESLQTEEQQEAEPSSRIARVPWNKGRRWSEDEKRKIGEGMKRKWSERKFRENITSKLKGREPWNKGRSMSQKTRSRIREALKGRIPWNKGKKLTLKTRKLMRASKLGKPLATATRRKMSSSHSGKIHTPATMRAISQKLAGVPKTCEHKKKISDSQKRRHAANRVLQDIEAAHKLQEPTPAHVVAGGGGGILSSVSSKPKLTRAEVLKSYKVQLREYRALQEEISPWTNAFRNRHGRKPTLADVEATKITWLKEKYKEYVVLRERLMSEIPILRKKLDVPQQASINSVGLTADDVVSALQRRKGSTSSPAQGTQIAERFTTALEYKRRLDKSARKDSDDQSNSNDDVQLLRGQKSTVPERVQNAMIAAMEYKKKAAVAGANGHAAAVDLQCGPSNEDVTLKKPEH